MDEIEALVRAAGGRTLGLFSSTRAAKAAAEEMRTRFGEDIPVLCQGDDQTGTLIKQFAADARTCLFGTMSLWQGVDVPGSACRLVIIDRIPFLVPTTRSLRRARRPLRTWAATGSWQCRRRTPLCGWLRVPGG